MNTITLPRSVVEQALEALEFSETPSHRTQYEVEVSASIALRAALGQPPVNSPEIPEGWRLVPEEPTLEMIKEMCAYDGTQYSDPFESDDFKDDYRNMLDAAPKPPVREQPQVEQEPAIYPEEAFDMGLEAIPYYTHPQNLNCKSTQARLATLWGYVKPQPPRQPLTDEEINNMDVWLRDTPFWRILKLARAIERAHGIGGEA